MRVSVSVPWLGLLLTLLTSGCANNGQVAVHPARGQVLFEGKPIPHAIVVLHFLNAPDKIQPQPRALVQDDGSFVLETYGTQDGAPAGEYAVTIEWWLSSGDPSDDAPPINHLPARFAKADTSGLRVHVEPGENHFPAIQLSR
jgi:hypothetical protein